MKLRKLLAPNRTKLELKLDSSYFLELVFSSSQSHQAGIETTNNFYTVDNSWTPNRTKLELKRVFSSRYPKGLFSPNRTKLELKLKKSIIEAPQAISSQSHQAGIETEFALLFKVASSAPNRTKLELKRVFSSRYPKGLFSPNRTKLELKLFKYMGISRACWTPNRTKLELKQGSAW